MAVLVVAPITPAARGDSPTPPLTYSKVTPDGKYVFVMISFLSAQDEAQWANPTSASQVAALRAAYPKSGMYRNDGSADPLWTVDWYADDVDLAADGVHMVRTHWGGHTTNADAVTFYANGNPLRTWKVGPLVDAGFLMPRSYSGFHWLRSSQFDGTTLRHAVETTDGNAFTFDAATGNIIAESRPGRLKAWAIGVGSFLALAAAVVWTRRQVRALRADMKKLRRRHGPAGTLAAWAEVPAAREPRRTTCSAGARRSDRTFGSREAAMDGIGRLLSSYHVGGITAGELDMRLTELVDDDNVAAALRLLPPDVAARLLHDAASRPDPDGVFVVKSVCDTMSAAERAGADAEELLRVRRGLRALRAYAVAVGVAVDGRDLREAANPIGTADDENGRTTRKP